MTTFDAEEFYAAWSAGDLATVVGRLHPDVDWPEPWTGGRVLGRAAVADHLARQARDVRFAVVPERVVPVDDGVAVTVHQVVRDADGDLLSDTRVLHGLTLDEGLLRRLDVGEPPP
ncbi:nuclear transport factor 2 family protein [Klenkia brasiliensis]|uniref:SnoaL-like domain-containing protein n=1 Tax=Klenkia brasiliensis TaxID=333142 RepID=A0A1G7Z9K4_9ACTN|nr:nuclear transport factor 2 family protein [Klenkia brasiliensis]SDH05216.1 SnoaL-like domain-containing protein [Klenkia brasiliensis]